LSPQFYEVHFISLTVAKLLRDLTTKYCRNRTSPFHLLSGSTPGSNGP